MGNDHIWKWDAKLSWELLSEAIYSYRQTLKTTTQKHKVHMFCKNGLFASVTSIETFVNEVLLNNFYWTKTQLDKKEHSIEFKIKKLLNSIEEEKCYKNFVRSKKIRNDFLVHHKRPDHRYIDEINVFLLLESIEATQEIIARISFEYGMSFPYWVSGVNFINPVDNDILLSNEIEFWRHIKTSGLFKGIETIYTPLSAEINYPKEWSEYKYLFKGLWKLLKDREFNFEIEKSNERFPRMPILSCKYWE